MKKKTGPKPEKFSIQGINWKDAIARAMAVKKPKDGWPKQGQKSQQIKSDHKR